MEYMVILVFGWPGAVIGSLLIISGISLQKPWLSVVGAVLSAGFCLYIALNPPPFRWLGLLALVGNGLSAAAIWRHKVLAAAALVLPYFMLEIYLAYAVLNQ